MTDLDLPKPYDADDIATRERLQAVFPAYLGSDDFEVEAVRIAPLGLGTSSAKLYGIDVVLAGRPDTVQLVLKTMNPPAREAHFYADLASELPLATPRVAASEIGEAGGWILMERLYPRNPMAWNRNDYRRVVEEMALLHARHWNRVESVSRHWMQPSSPEALRESAAELQRTVETIAGSWLATEFSSIFSPGRIRRILAILENVERFASILRKAGLTLVHGDYWFYNVLLFDDGRSVLVDWQSPMIWSGFWELAYFINLLMPMGGAGFREMPTAEAEIVTGYRDAIRANGVDISDFDFSACLDAGRVLQPLLHWLPQLAGSAVLEPHPVSEPTKRFFSKTFDGWEEAVGRLSGG